MSKYNHKEAIREWDIRMEKFWKMMQDNVRKRGYSQISP